MPRGGLKGREQTGGADFTLLIYPYVSSGGSRLTGAAVGWKLERPRLAVRIYDAAPVFVCSFQTCEYIRKEERKGGAGETWGNASF